MAKNKIICISENTVTGWNLLLCVLKLVIDLDIDSIHSFWLLNLVIILKQPNIKAIEHMVVSY